MRFAVTQRVTGVVALVSGAALLAGCASPGGSSARPATGESGSSVSSPTASSTGAGLVAPDARRPESSVCGKASGPFAVVETNPAAPAPRCVVVQPGQRLRVVNTSDRDEASGKPVTVNFAGYPARTVRLHRATTYDRDFGDYLAPGVHDLRVSIYSAPGAEIWLKR